MKGAEHRQLEAESLVEAARERDPDEQLLREALGVLQRCQFYIEGHVTARQSESDREAINRTRDELLKHVQLSLTDLEERLLEE